MKITTQYKDGTITIVTHTKMGYHVAFRNNKNNECRYEILAGIHDKEAAIEITQLTIEREFK